MTDPVTPSPQPPQTPAPPPSPPKWLGLPSGFATIRDVICFVFGASIIVHEVFLSATVQTASVGVGVALCGLPLVFGADDKRKGG